MVEVGESTGALAEMLNSVADFYDEENETSLERFSNLVQPVLLIVMGIILAGLIGTLGFSNILNFCGATGDPGVCAMINRDAAGSLWLDPTACVRLDTINIGGSDGAVSVNINGSAASGSPCRTPAA